MKGKIFYLIFIFILVFGLILKIIPLLNNNFYFTMDQGRDSVYVREMLQRKQIILLGPQTGIEGVYTGPLWFYFISVGYLLFGGHPAGAVFMLILLNTSLSAILMLWLKKKIAPALALIIGFALQIFWPFYNTSRYAFNPFPITFLSFLLILFLINSFCDKKYFVLGGILVGLAFNCEIAGASALGLFYFLTGIVLKFKKKITLKTIVLGLLTTAVFLIPTVISEFNTNFSQINAVLNQKGNTTNPFSGTSYVFMAKNFLKLFQESIIPQNFIASLIIFIIITTALFKFSIKNNLLKLFVFLALFLLTISYLWFGSFKGWQDWNTAYLPPIIITSLLLMIFSLPKKISISLFIIIIFCQGFSFQSLYLQNLKSSDDQSILKNELSALDWVYQKSDGHGFFVYNYLPSVLDYPYQYLFWWQGKKKYGYLPCEYSSFPSSPKLFIPGSKYYQTPNKECDKTMFLIIEPDKNLIVQKEWFNTISVSTTLIEEVNIGMLRVQKRLKN